MKKIYSNENVCIGCGLCEVWCQVAHSESKDIIKAFKKEKTPNARVKVQDEKPVTFALQCRHCKTPDCVYSCLTGAMTVDKATGQVQHNRDKCIGCYTCMLVCPYGAIKKDEAGKNKVISKCDFCKGREIPACVEHCPNEALKVLEDEGVIK